jgi:hypothetical protein
LRLRKTTSVTNSEYTAAMEADSVGVKTPPTMPTTMITGTPSGQAAVLIPSQMAPMPRKRGCSRGKSYFSAKKCDCTIRLSPMRMPGRMPPISNAPIDTPAVAP